MLQALQISNIPNQTQSVTLSIDNTLVTVQLLLRFNLMAGYWTLTIMDSNGNLIIDSVPLLTGVYPAANLLVQQQYLNIGAWYVVNVSGTTAQDYPVYLKSRTGFSDLGGRHAAGS